MNAAVEQGSAVFGSAIASHSCKRGPPLIPGATRFAGTRPLGAGRREPSPVPGSNGRGGRRWGPAAVIGFLTHPQNHHPLRNDVVDAPGPLPQGDGPPVPIDHVVI
jgi:hypothetical protein